MLTNLKIKPCFDTMPDLPDDKQKFNMTKKYQTKIEGIAKCQVRNAFTLLELLLVIAIIAVMAGIVVFNLRPADVLKNVNDVKNVANSNDIKKALEAYTLDHGGNLPTSLQGQSSGEYTICKQGEVSCPVGSISLDELISGGYLSAIPVNDNLAGEKTTGYAIEYDATKETVEIIAGAVALSEYGTGADGAVIISTNKNINTDTIATGRTCADGINYSVTVLTTNSATLSTTPAAGCLAANDTVLLINLQGISTNYLNVGNYELLTVQSATGTNVTFTSNKTKYYGNGASDDTNLGTATTNQRVMLQRVPNYTNVTINNGVTLTASAWDGTKGGVLMFKASNTATVSGTVDMNNTGYRGGNGNTGCTSRGFQGESANGTGLQSNTGNLGGGGASGSAANGYYPCDGRGHGAAGGSYGTQGQDGSNYCTDVNGSCSNIVQTYGLKGSTYGDQELTKLHFGSGGGSSEPSNSVNRGGGMVYIMADSVQVNGYIRTNGNVGVDTTIATGRSGGAGGGAGGSIKIESDLVDVGTNKVLALGGNGGLGYSDASGTSGNGGNGGVGRIAISGTVNGTTNPTYTAL